MNRAEILEACMKDNTSMAAAYERAKEIEAWLKSGTVAELAAKPAKKKHPPKLTTVQKSEILDRLAMGGTPPAIAKAMGLPSYQVRYVRTNDRKKRLAESA